MPSLLIMNYVPLTGYPSVLPYMIYIIYDKSPEIFSWAALRRRRRRLRRGGGGGSHNSAKKAEGKDFHDHLRSLWVLQNFGLQPFCRRSTGGRCQAVSPKNLFPSPLCVNKPANFSDPQFIHWESQQVSPNFSDEVWKITLHQTNSVCSFKTCLKKTIYLSFNPHQDQHQMTRPNFRKFVWQILWKMFNTADLVIPSRTNTAIHGLNKQKLVESSFTFKDLIFQTLAS